jgi:hypothetical protein
MLKKIQGFVSETGIGIRPEKVFINKSKIHFESKSQQKEREENKSY